MWQQVLQIEVAPGEIKRKIVWVLLIVGFFFLVKIFVKFALLVVFVFLSSFFIKFFTLTVCVIFWVKLLGAALLRWTVDDSRYSHVKIEPLKNSLKILCNRTCIPFNSIYMFCHDHTKCACCLSATTHEISYSVYIYGFLGIKKLVIERGVFQLLTKNELLAVIADEVVHWKFEDNLVKFLYFYIQNIFVFLVLKYFISKKVIDYFDILSDRLYCKWIVCLPFVPIYYRLTDILLNVIVQRQQFYADYVAVKLGYGEYLKSALVKTYVAYGYPLNPNFWFSLINHNQACPPLITRLRKIDYAIKEMNV